MKLKDLVGYQLVSIDDAKIIVKKGNRKYVFSPQRSAAANQIASAAFT